MGELKNPKLAIPVVLMAGIFWSFGPYVVRNIDQAHTVPWQYLFTRGLVIFILLNLYLYLEEGLSFISNYKRIGISGIVGGTGLHPVADACDFARHCSALDFWAITDHAEASTPKRWNETKETIRKCNSLNTNKSNPDCVAFNGWEWTQVGINRNIHWGHHNVILAEEDDTLLPERAIASKIDILSL